MNCPACEATLVMTERQGIEIDYCPKCRGVWLDRGELDKIVERAADASAARTPVRQSAQVNPPYAGPHPGSSSHPGYYKKKESFLGEIFDF